MTYEEGDIFQVTQRSRIFVNKKVDPKRVLLQRTYSVGLKDMSDEELLALWRQFEEELLTQNILQDARSKHTVPVVKMSFFISSENIFYQNYLYPQQKYNLAQFLEQTKEKQDPTMLFQIFFQVAAGIQALHSRNLVHLNLKPSNIMIGENNLAMVADYTSQPTYDPVFSAPELIASQQKSEMCDVYSLGCLIFYAFTGKEPYADLENKLDIPKQPFLLDYFNSCPAYSGIKLNKYAAEMIERCCKRNPEDRVSLDRIYEVLNKYAYPEKSKFSIYPAEHTLNQGKYLTKTNVLDVQELGKDDQVLKYDSQGKAEQEKPSNQPQEQNNQPENK